MALCIILCRASRYDVTFSVTLIHDFRRHSAAAPSLYEPKSMGELQKMVEIAIPYLAGEFIELRSPSLT